MIFRFGNDNDPAVGYAYWTQVADKSKTPSMAALEKLEKKMEQHGFDTGDICSRNTGFVKNKLVCIDFCPASMCWHSKQFCYTGTIMIDIDDNIELTVDLHKHNLGKGSIGKVIAVRQPDMLFEIDFDIKKVPVSIRQMKKA